MYKELVINGKFTTEEALKHKTNFHKVAKECEALVIDLRNIEDADIVGVNVLATTHKILSDRGRKLELKVSPDSELMSLLELTKFKHILKIN